VSLLYTHSLPPYCCPYPCPYCTLTPSLPNRCSFLDSLTEELEETQRNEVYEDYKFVTREELHAAGLEGLVGTNMLKAYMHGFFVDAQVGPCSLLCPLAASPRPAVSPAHGC
jgi:hypothetical protein